MSLFVVALKGREESNMSWCLLLQTHWPSYMIRLRLEDFCVSMSPLALSWRCVGAWRESVGTSRMSATFPVVQHLPLGESTQCCRLQKGVLARCTVSTLKLWGVLTRTDRAVVASCCLPTVLPASYYLLIRGETDCWLHARTARTMPVAQY